MWNEKVMEERTGAEASSLFSFKFVLLKAISFFLIFANSHLWFSSVNLSTAH